MFLPDETASERSAVPAGRAAAVPHRRLIWAATRSVLEADKYKHRKYGEKKRRHWTLGSRRRNTGQCTTAFMQCILLRCREKMRLQAPHKHGTGIWYV